MFQKLNLTKMLHFFVWEVIIFIVITEFFHDYGGSRNRIVVSFTTLNDFETNTKDEHITTGTQ